MSAVFKERSIDPPDFDPRSWYELSDEEKIACLTAALDGRSSMIDRLYREAFAHGVDAFDYRNE